MKGWGDLNAALNGLVNEGVIVGFRTNREDKAADPSVAIRLHSGTKEAFAMRLVRDALTGPFADAILSVEIVE
jgi:hypothetical protein